MEDEEEFEEEIDNEENITCDYCGEFIDEDQGYFCSKECAKAYKQDNE